MDVKEMMMMKNKKKWEEKSKADADDDKVSKNVAIGLGIAGVALVAWGLSSLFSGETMSKTMKAPGRPGVYISRHDFESNTAAYFRDLRKSK